LLIWSKSYKKKYIKKNILELELEII